MATNMTLADLIGSDSTATVVSDVTLSDVQEASPPGLSIVFSTSLGEKGRIMTLAGLLRFTSSTSLAAAVSFLETQRTTLTDLRKDGTLINAFTGSANFETLYGQLTNCTVNGLLFGRRSKAQNGSEWVVIQDYQLVLRKLR